MIRIIVAVCCLIGTSISANALHVPLPTKCLCYTGGLSVNGFPFVVKKKNGRNCNAVCNENIKNNKLVLTDVSSSRRIHRNRHVYKHYSLRHWRHRTYTRHVYSHRQTAARIVTDNHRPRAWCGWQMRQWLHVADASFNLARNWLKYGRPTSPGPGVLVIWSHHVGLITGRDARGQWIVKSGNDGHMVRERPRSIAGAIGFRTS